MANGKLIFSIDLGIASCGWAVVRLPSAPQGRGEFLGTGSWCFDAPEEGRGKNRHTKNQNRRFFRLARRVIRRRRKRMSELRFLFYQHGLLPTAGSDALRIAGLDPWELRAKGLEKPLNAQELAVALGHIAKRRGFKSNAKRKSNNPPNEDQENKKEEKKMLAALAKTSAQLQNYKTVGEMFSNVPEYSQRKRNREAKFHSIVQRDDLVREVTVLFARQRRFGQPLASAELEDAFKTIAFRQLPLQDSEQLVGMCPFERDKKRAAKHAPSFERMRFLARLANVRIATPEGARPLSEEEFDQAATAAGGSAKFTWKALRKATGLGDAQFTPAPKDEGHDIVARTGESMTGTRVLRETLGDQLWHSLQKKPEMPDTIAQVISFHATQETILQELEKLALPESALEALRLGLNKGAFERFNGAGSISSKACRAMMPFLEKGAGYTKACELAGYDPSATNLSSKDQVTNKKQFLKLKEEVAALISSPTARKALEEALKQLWAMRNKWGLPDAIHIELARDIGKGLLARHEIEKGIAKATRDKEAARKQACEDLETHEVDANTLLLYRLWKEQGGKCIYSGKDIHPSWILSPDNEVEIEHILPRSRFADNSYFNKAICLTSENRDKGNRTPFEWYQATKSPQEWEEFALRVESNKQLRGLKKRNLLLCNASEREEQFLNRNLNDTRYASRILAEAVKLFYPLAERGEKGGRRRVFVRPGALVNEVRKLLGLNSLKKSEDGKRIEDDRHHALDAMLIAAIDEGTLNRLTRYFQSLEEGTSRRSVLRMPEPWQGFREDVKAAYEGVFVARPERRRARGEGHAATILSLTETESGQKTIKRVSIHDLGMEKKKFHKDKAFRTLENIRDPERNAALRDAVLRWIEAGRPMDEASLPRSPAGHIISKISIETTDKPGISVRGGTAARGNIVRVDLFTAPNSKGKEQWYAVPVYVHQIMDKAKNPFPPSKIATSKCGEEEWQEIGPQHIFRFSLYKGSLVQVETGDTNAKGARFVEGYYSTFDRDGCRIYILPMHCRQSSMVEKISYTNLQSFKKFNVDRLGNRHEIRSETRTWHGAACISQSPPG